MPYFIKKVDQNNYNQTPQESVPNVEADKPQTDTTSLNPLYYDNDLKGLLRIISIKYDLSDERYQQLVKTITCESNWEIDVYSKNKISYGIAQFRESTWDWFNKMRGTNMDYKSPYAQLDMMTWAFKNGYASQWDCYRLLGY